MLPWLALPDGTFFGFPGSAALRFPDAAGYHGSCDDWLIFNGDGDGHGGDGYLLANPFSGDTVQLPGLSCVRFVVTKNGEALAWRRVTDDRRSPPRDDDRTMAVRKLVVCPDGFIAAIFGREHFAKVALCSLETFSWSHSAHDRWRWYDDLAFCGSRLYAITADEDLLALDVGVDGDTGEPFVSRVERVIEGHCPRTIAVVHYLVPSAPGGGALLMVRRRFPHDEDGRSRFTVFRADLASSRGHVRDDCAGMWFWEPRRRADHHAAVYDMFDGTVSDILPRQTQDDGPALATWLFPD
ncbi:hypothetical protein SETIT_9G350200v2 [Setaria italica]|uniref:KIB1-4 beta-propeller domain-containing protein n=1 Tax=Setaria italica TaxID=4555 RepID=A0A368SNY7_SETIT|nr:hypothetical protein SETIT_9G350200v2 [Setaria italica]